MLTEYEIIITDIIIEGVPGAAFSVFVIVLAMVMLRSKKQALEEDEE